MSDSSKRTVKICFSVASVLLPAFFVVSSLLETGPSNDEAEYFLGKVITYAVLFMVFANVSIWGFGRRRVSDKTPSGSDRRAE
jgi:hypothetical protein